MIPPGHTISRIARVSMQKVTDYFSTLSAQANFVRELLPRSIPNASEGFLYRDL